MPLEAFHRRSSNRDGRQSACIECKRRRDRRFQGPRKLALAAAWRRANPDVVKAHDNGRRALTRKARLRWVDWRQVARAYRLARALRDLGVNAVVDHWLPLRGKTVCGLHVQTNLVLAHHEDNGRKRAAVLDGEPPAIAVPRSFACDIEGKADSARLDERCELSALVQKC